MTLREAARILRRRWILILSVFVATCAATLLATSFMRPVYESRARLMIQPAASNPSNALPGLAALLGAPGGTTLDTQMEQIQSRNFMSEVARKAKYRGDPMALLAKVKLAPSAGGQILVITVRGDTAQEAARIANLISDVFIEQSKQEASNKATGSVAALERAKIQANRDKANAIAAYNGFLKKIGISDPAVLYNTRANMTEMTRIELQKNRSNLAGLDRQRQEVIAQVSRTKPEIRAAFSRDKNPGINQYQQQLYDLRVKRGAATFDFQEDSPEVRAIDVQIQEATRAYDRASKNPYSIGSESVTRNPEYVAAAQSLNNLDASAANLNATIAENEKLLGLLSEEQKRLTPQRAQYEDLRRTRDNAISTFDKYTTIINEVKLNRLALAPSVKPLERAIPFPAPISPKPILNMVLAVGLGLFLGIGLALLIEYFSQPEYDAETQLYLPQVAGVPLLGSASVGLLGNLPPGQLPGQQQARLEDTFREIGHILAHRDPKQPAPVVLLAGTRSDETTAAIAAQISAVLVRDGLRVTLVDADRAHPRLNRVFGAPDAPGLAEVLSGKHGVREILHIGADGMLRFLSAGSPENRAPYTQKQLRAILGDLGTDTDLVLISGPSVWTAQSIAALERASSGMALVASSDVPAEESVARARRLLSNGYQPRILGVIINELGDETVPAAIESTKEIVP